MGSQAVICLVLQRHFSTDPIVAEEDVDMLRDNQSLAERVHELVTKQTSGITPTHMLEAIALGKKKVDFTKRY